MPPTLLACGSNAASHLAINHSLDVSTFTPCSFHPSLSTSILDDASIIDLVSASSHSLLLLSNGAQGRNTLLGAGTNTLGQLGPRCALWDDIRPESRWKIVDILSSLGHDVKNEDWEPVKVAVTWTTSFVVYQRVQIALSTSTESGESGSGVNTERDLINQPDQILISCGSNDFGELGAGSNAPTTLDAPIPIPISQPSQKPTIVDLGLKKGERVSLLKGGQRHVIAVIDGLDGQRVIGWGASRKGELDPGTAATSDAVGSAGPSRNGASDRSSGNGKGKGKGKANGYPPLLPPTTLHLPLKHDERIVDIALGASHTLAVVSTGRVIAWGSDIKGQIGGVGTTKGVKGIAATWGGSYILTEEGVYSQGSNTHSQLLREYASSVSSETGAGMIQMEEGWKVERIIAGSEHLLVLASWNNGQETQRSLWTGGWNEHGNLAFGDQVDRSSLCKVDVRGKILGAWGGCATSWIWVEE